MLTTQELRKLDKNDLEKEISKAQNELAKVKIQVVDQNLNQSHKIKQLKRFIARAKTIGNENLNNN
ncbi:50S ribosomal protein L29 [Candidatus Peregrinibacteria bacterium]|nr:50S ribosomal protein L29 [Candidatus Peregrinibacteria bacterium]